MNREKMIEEVYQRTLDTISSIDDLSVECTSMIAVDFMLEKFKTLMEAAKTDRHCDTDRYCTCTLCKTLKQLEEND